ncbi:hypothetical protein, partial [Pseudomonas sp. GM55]|uniref:hypothetical protein n=1 Tax=Pseudomonas sp. GM55 TaxID=1144333 RepID=UPI001EE6862A
AEPLAAVTAATDMYTGKRRVAQHPAIASRLAREGGLTANHCLSDAPQSNRRREFDPGNVPMKAARPPLDCIPSMHPAKKNRGPPPEVAVFHRVEANPINQHG